MKRSTKILGVITLVIGGLTAIAPWFADRFGDPKRSIATSFDTGGPLGLGFDYLGRPIAPQLFEGGRALLLAALAAAVLSQLVGLGMGLWMAAKSIGSPALRFGLDVLLLIPAIVTSLIAFYLAGSNLYAVIPITAVLTLPFSSRYYQANAEPLLRSGFYQHALVAGDSVAVALVREVIPVLKRPILTDLGYSIIGAVYLMATVSFLGSAADTAGFLWPRMVSDNLAGIELNPWACLAPLLAIMALTVPLNLMVDSLGGDELE